MSHNWNDPNNPFGYGYSNAQYPSYNYTVQTTSAQTVDATSLQNVLMRMSQELWQTKGELENTRAEIRRLAAQVRWLSSNPGMTADDYENYLKVSTMIGEAAKDGQLQTT